MSTYAEDNITITSQKSLNDKVENVNQYFWYEETGTHAGAHITEVPQDDFKTNPQGGNLLAKSNGLAVRDGTTELATFGATGAYIGENVNGQSRTEILADGMQIIRNRNGSDVTIAHLGYGLGNNSSGGTSYAPYTSLGVRSGALGNYSVAEGDGNTASGYCAHAEGSNTTSSGKYSHAEGGGGTTASGDFGSHAEGANTTASGDYGSHAEGFNTEASGDYGAHAQNWGTKASSRAQTALGKFNVEDSNGDYAVILGNGTGNGSRSNAMTIDWNGNIDIAGEYRVNGTPIGGGGVTGVKGDNESTYRTGNVNITPANLGEADFVVEQGTGGDWIYRKWNSGIAECWATLTTTARTNSSDGGGYVSETAVTPSAFPFTFTEIPNVQCSINSSSVTGSPTSTAQSSTTSAGSWKLYRNTSNTSTSTKRFNFYVIGKWK